MFNPKVKIGLELRAQTLKNLEALAEKARGKKVLLAHVSSVGEYLQLLPVIENLKKSSPDLNFFLSYFSPSLFNFLQDRAHPFEAVFSFPGDGKKRVTQLLNTLNPQVLMFSKIDLWPNLIVEAHERKIPLYLISATLTENSKRQGFFSFFYAYLYQLFTGIFSVSKRDTERFKERNPRSHVVLTTGDTRIDSVVARAIKETDKVPAYLRELVAQSAGPCLVVGSSWPKDEALLFQALKNLKNFGTQIPFIVWAPHECDEAHLKAIEGGLRELGLENQRLSSLSENESQSRVEPLRALVVDRIGYLVGLYSLGKIAFVGSGRGGVHNILEPIQAGLAVLFGPRYHNAPEAIALLELGAVKSVSTPLEATEELKQLLSHPRLAAERAELGQKFLENQRGAATYCADFIRKGLAGTHV